MPNSLNPQYWPHMALNCHHWLLAANQAMTDLFSPVHGLRSMPLALQQHMSYHCHNNGNDDRGCQVEQALPCQLGPALQISKHLSRKAAAHLLIGPAAASDNPGNDNRGRRKRAPPAHLLRPALQLACLRRPLHTIIYLARQRPPTTHFWSLQLD